MYVHNRIQSLLPMERSIAKSGKEYNVRKCITKCIECGDTYIARVSDVKSNKSTRCPSCTSSGYKLRHLHSNEDVIQRFKLVHGDKYDYTKVLYSGTDNKVTIICPIHGEFTQRPHQHLRGEGCKACGYDVVSSKGTISFNEFVKRAAHTHGNRYNYDASTYTKAANKVKITCAKHGDFWQQGDMHYKGQGCPACRPGGFTVIKPGILYYVYLPEHNLYKIGITNGTVFRRFMHENIKYTVLFQHKFLDGYECSAVETLILNNYKEFMYTGDKIMSSGNTELFTIDIFQGEYNAIYSDTLRYDKSSKRNVSRTRSRAPSRLAQTVT